MPESVFPSSIQKSENTSFDGGIGGVHAAGLFFTLMQFQQSKGIGMSNLPDLWHVMISLCFNKSG